MSVHVPTVPDRVARVVVPVGLGVYTWLAVVLVAGVFLRSGLFSVSISGVLGLLALFLPLYAFAPWRPDLTDRVLEWGRERRVALGLAAGAFLLLRTPVIAVLLAPFATVLQYPTLVFPQLVFDAWLFYGERVGDATGRWLFQFGRWYLELLWLYVLASAVALLVPGGDEDD